MVIELEGTLIDPRRNVAPKMPDLNRDLGVILAVGLASAAVVGGAVVVLVGAVVRRWSR
jgi:hypothetical protein